MDREQFAAYYGPAVDRLVGKLTASGGDVAVARAAVQEAMIRHARRLSELPDTDTADERVAQTARRLVATGWAARHRDSFGDLGAQTQARPDGSVPTAALAVATVHRLARRRGRVIAGLALVVALALLAVGALQVARQRPAPAPTTPTAGDVRVCVAPAAWRTALSPDGAAWDNLTGLSAGSDGVVGWFRMPPGSRRYHYELRWLPDADPARAIVLDDVNDDTFPVGGPIMVGSGFVAWTGPVGLKIWDGTTTKTLDTGGHIPLTHATADGLVWAEIEQLTLSQRITIRSYGAATGTTTTLAVVEPPDGSYLMATGPDFYALGSQTDLEKTIYGFDGTQVASTNAPSIQVVGSLDGATAYAAGSELHVLRDGRDEVVWTGRITDRSGTHSAALQAPSVDGGFLVFVAADGFHIVDLTTRREAVVPRYEQSNNRWVATAALNNGAVAYSGTDQQLANPNPDLAPPIPDGGPRFTRLAELPRVTC